MWPANATEVFPSEFVFSKSSRERRKLFGKIWEAFLFCFFSEIEGIISICDFNLHNFKANGHAPSVGPVMLLSAPATFFFLSNICGRPAPLQRARRGGKPTVLLFTFHPRSPLTHGCYRSELSTNQLSARICPTPTVCLLFSALVSARGHGWTLWGLKSGDH